MTNEDKDVRDFLAWSVVNSMCFSALIGAVALFFSIETRNNLDKGNIDNAKRSSKYSFWNNLFATGMGSILIVMLFIFFHLFWLIFRLIWFKVVRK